MVKQGLAPGVHFMQGDKVIKSLSLVEAGQWETVLGFGDSRNPSPERLASSVAWVFIALQMRAGQVMTMPVEWERNGEPVEEPPFRIQTRDLLMRIDRALQLYGQAFIFKQRAGSRFIGLRWLDPAATRPDVNRLTIDGYEQYIYTTQRGERYIPADDVIHFLLPGMREFDPAPAAGKASSLAAQVLLGMEQTADTFYDTNGLPVIAVIVPERTTAQEQERTRSGFERIFRRKRSLDGNKTIGLKAGTDIKTISFAPKDLAMAELEGSKIDAILLSHDVPPAIVHRDVNRAEAELKQAQFVSVIDGRLRWIADKANADEDIARSGVLLTIHAEQHPLVQAAELQQALAVQALTDGPLLTVNEARERLGYEPLPERSELLEQQTSDNGAGEQSGITEKQVLNGAQITSAIGIIEGFASGLYPRSSAVNMMTSFFNMPQEAVERIVPTSPGTVDTNAKRAELAALRTFVKRGKHEERPFKLEALTPAEVPAELRGAVAADAPFRWDGY